MCVSPLCGATVTNRAISSGENVHVSGRRPLTLGRPVSAVAVTADQRRRESAIAMAVMLGQRNGEAHSVLVAISLPPGWPTNLRPADQLLRRSITAGATPARTDGIEVLYSAVHAVEGGNFICCRNARVLHRLGHTASRCPLEHGSS